MSLLVVNIIMYAVSADYRFFLKKMKYPEEIVYTQKGTVTDTDKIEIIDSTPEKLYDNDYIETSENGMTFLDALAGKTIIEQEVVLPNLSIEEQEFLQIFENYELNQLASPSTLFEITTEYPDPYYELYSPELSVYVFSTKSYAEVKNIFQVLSDELPFRINAVNNFAEASFYINLDETFDDGFVRIVLKYKNKAFWLKIQKDLYNTIKPILETL